VTTRAQPGGPDDGWTVVVALVAHQRFAGVHRHAHREQGAQLGQQRPLRAQRGGNRV
jgi:hypothetical protein